MDLVPPHTQGTDPGFAGKNDSLWQAGHRTHPQGGGNVGNYFGNDYRGNWGAYPYLPSGIIIAQDMQVVIERIDVLEPANFGHRQIGPERAFEHRQVRQDQQDQQPERRQQDERIGQTRSEPAQKVLHGTSLSPPSCQAETNSNWASISTGGSLRR